MKMKHIYRYSSLAACSVIITALTGMGALSAKDRFTAGSDIIISDNANFIQTNNEIKTGIPAKTFYSALVDNKNTKWFLTELGIVSFSGDKWTLHNENNKIG